MSSNSELYRQLLDSITERTSSGKLDWVLEQPAFPCMVPKKLNGIPCEWTTYSADIGVFQYCIVRYTDSRSDDRIVIGFGFALINGEGTLLDWSTFIESDNPLFELLSDLFKTIRGRLAQPEGELAKSLESAIRATKGTTQIVKKRLYPDDPKMTVEEALAVNMPFGKYLGYTLAEVVDTNLSYLNWLTEIETYGELSRAIPVLIEHFKEEISNLPTRPPYTSWYGSEFDSDDHSESLEEDHHR